MQFIQGQPRHQTYFATLEDQVGTDNPVRLMDAFIEKLDLQKLGFNKTVHHSEGPPYAPQVLLKLYCSRLFFIIYLITGACSPTPGGIYSQDAGNG